MCSPKNFKPGAFERFWTPFIRFFQVDYNETPGTIYSFCNFIHIFQVFCVSHYSIYHRHGRIYRFLYHIAFFAMHAFIMIYTLRTIHHLASTDFKEIPLMNYVSFMSITGDFVEHAMAHIEPLFTRKQEEEMYRRFEEINTIFATKLNHIVDFEVLRKKQMYTIGFFIASTIQAFGLSFFSLPTGSFNIFFYLLCRAAAVTIIRVRRCQASIIINLLSNILMDVQILLKQLQENYGPNCDRHMSENIIHLRDIYSNVWLLKNSFSCCFGWSFFTFVMDYCFDFINSSYWAYITIKTYKSKIKTIRKNAFSNSFFFLLQLIS